MFWSNQFVYYSWLPVNMSTIYTRFKRARLPSEPNRKKTLISQTTKWILDLPDGWPVCPENCWIGTAYCVVSCHGVCCVFVLSKRVVELEGFKRLSSEIPKDVGVFICCVWNTNKNNIKKGKHTKNGLNWVMASSDQRRTLYYFVVVDILLHWLAWSIIWTICNIWSLFKWALCVCVSDSFDILLFGAQ